MNTKGITRVFTFLRVSDDQLAQMKVKDLESLVFHHMARQMGHHIAEKREFMTEEVNPLYGGKDFRMGLVIMSEQRFRELVDEARIAGYSGREFSVDQLLRAIDHEQNPPKVGPSAEEVQRVAKAIGVDGKDGKS